jgi:UDPglucose--hexose-1-phosphate uridylyltransferase
VNHTPDYPAYRRCPLTGRVVILAPERASRPMTLEHAAPHQRNGQRPSYCPFCVGNEHDTPTELHAIRDDIGWQVRVVGNRFPAVRPDAPGFGFHEVVIECREHFTHPTEYAAAQLAKVIQTYRDRTLVHFENPQIEQVVVFKNVGAEAGASLEHAHSQIIALPFVSPVVLRELHAVSNYRHSNRDCFFCHELRVVDRRIVQTPSFTALCPYAPRSAFEFMILPNYHVGRFETITNSLAQELAELLHRVLVALDECLARPAYNWYIHSLPRANGDYHWHLEIIPRTARAAGFEWSSGIFINDTLPEVAAERLRANLA